ncbi:hypothetical protein QBC34DRAFT_312098 [Podospora aff. communis PSN243]|uniref:Uncharacterized protein n=1 Tax=Podospora aff. communis PSN243 TaxID=3040156 RepID=A0AAV9G3Z9_9PEZI|nr:hypothetical protein QBC34DRAFT_312098 [Podospora aff. communis PSN243]
MFTAIGSFGKPKSCSNSSACVVDPIKVAGRLTRPVDLVPTPVPIPAGANASQCLEKSQQREIDNAWSITKLNYQITRGYLTGYGLLSQTDTWTWYRTLELTIENRVVGVTQSCTLSDAAIDNPTGQWFLCLTPPHPHTLDVHRTVKTHIQLNTSPLNSATLRINQTWYCDHPSSPVEITAHGLVTSNTVLPAMYCGTRNDTGYNMQCGLPNAFTGLASICDYHATTTWCQPRWIQSYPPTPQDPGRYTYPIPVRATDITTTRLPPDALTSPLGGTSCTVLSLGRPVTWTLSHPSSPYLTFTPFFPPNPNIPNQSPPTTHHDRLPTNISLVLTSSIFPSSPLSLGVTDEYLAPSAFFTPYLPGWEPNRTFTYRDADPQAVQKTWPAFNMLGWKFRMDVSRGYLEVEKGWYCDDGDLGRPVVFRGVWRGLIKGWGCEWVVRREDEVEGIGCGVGGGRVEVRPEVSWSVREGVVEGGFWGDRYGRGWGWE